ncbi:MAG: mannosyltransferase family protein [Verrucomicrobiota bacterium]
MSEIANQKSPLFDSIKRAVSVLPKDDWLVVGWVLATKLLLFVFCAKSFQVLEDKPLKGGFGWLEIWNRWDSLHYLEIAQFGYNPTGVLKAWFYPFFPWCVRSVAWLNGNYLLSGFIVSAIASVIAAILLRRITLFDHSAEVARRTVWFFLIFPTAYFLHISYTESLFLALALGSIVAARSERWWLAGMLGALCGMTRANGIILIPTLGVEVIHQLIVTRRWQWRWLWLALLPAGFGVYLLVNWKISGDPFAFLRMRKNLFAMSMAGPWVGIREAIGNLQRSPSQAEIVGAQELYFVGLGFVCSILSWIKLRPLYAMWITGNWLLVASVTFLVSLPRYCLTMFPIFILFALLAKNRFWNAVITVWSLLFLALFASLFVRGWWAF